MKYTSPKPPKTKELDATLQSKISGSNSSGDKDELVPPPPMPYNDNLQQPKLNGSTTDSPTVEIPANNSITSPLTKDNIKSVSTTINNEFSTTKSIETNNNNNNVSGNDSAIVNISDDIEPRPRSNLLALLDREYKNNGNGEGGIHKNQAVQDESDICTIRSDTDKADIDKYDIKAESESNKNRDTEETNSEATTLEKQDCIETIKTNETVDFDSVDSSEDDKQQLNSLEYFKPLQEAQSTNEHATSFHRSASMEPLGLLGQSTSIEDETTIRQINSEEIPPGSSTPIVYDMSNEDPASPLMSDINASSGMGSPSLSTANTTSEIGGDTYFDASLDGALAAARRRRIEEDEEKKQRRDSFEDDLVHVTLPPRVTRTTLTGYARDDDSNNNNSAGSPFLTTPTRNRATSPLPPAHPLSPRQEFAHTHSLLDDCSDEEEETSIRIESPERNINSYSCLPRSVARSTSEGSPFSYFKKQQKQENHRQQNTSSYLTGPNSATKVANNNIQQALLKTRHRRWDCQSTLAGPHAQSNQVFDISHRVYYTHTGYYPETNGEIAIAARLSVSVDSIKAAALASGLWRTVRLVNLPKGLFGSNRSSIDESIDEDLCALLKMLHTTFPVLDQLNFGGDISADNTSKADDDNDDWRNEIVSFIMECVPNLVAIDGFVVERDVEIGNSNSQEDESVVTLNSIDDDRGRLNIITSSNSQHDSSDRAAENIAYCNANSEYVSMLSELVDGDEAETPKEAKSSDEADNSNHQTTLIKGSHTMQDFIEEDDTKKVSPLTLATSTESANSSQSWGSTNSSSSRPPPCPTSSTKPRSRLPTKPIDKKKPKAGSFVKAGSRLKRRVLGMMPAVSIMDDDFDDDDDDDDLEDVEDGDSEDCPTDLL